MSAKEALPDDRDAPAEAGEDLLERIGLNDEEIAALRQKGTITQERRGRDTVIFKLRYRIAARQHVKYLGTNRRFVEQIRAELNDLQAAHRRHRRLRRLETQARTLLQDTKLRLEAPLKQAGLKFHGRAIRRPRNQNEVMKNTNLST